MNHTDKIEFRNIMDSLSEYYQREKLTPIAMKIYFDCLADYEIEQISTAITKHLRDKNHGKFFPKSSDLILHIDGGEISKEYLIVSAKLAETPIGVLSRIFIGTFDLNHQSDFYLHERAKECLLMIPRWKERAMSGSYSDHEISMMLKYDVDPLSPFCLGQIKPSNESELRNRVLRIQKTERHIKLLLTNTENKEAKTDVDPKTKKIISDLVNSMKIR